MRAICVDDERAAVNLLVALCQKLPQLDEVTGFTDPREALEWMEVHPVELALLDVDMPEVDGLKLARIIQERYPNTAIIFVTGYPQFAVDAFALHASGYLLKPIDRERLSREVDHALKGRPSTKRHTIEVQTFGNFNFLVDGRVIGFGRAKAKELMAFLVDRRGNGVTRSQIAAALWEDHAYDRPIQKQMDVLIRNVKTALRECDISELVTIENGVLRLRPELLDCDLYRFLGGEEDAIRAFHGEYMTPYPWAEETTAELTAIKNGEGR